MDDELNNVVLVKNEGMFWSSEVRLQGSTVDDLEQRRKVGRLILDSVDCPLQFPLASTENILKRICGLTARWLLSTVRVNWRSILRVAGALPPGAPGFSRGASSYSFRRLETPSSALVVGSALGAPS